MCIHGYIFEEDIDLQKKGGCLSGGTGLDLLHFINKVKFSKQRLAVTIIDFSREITVKRPFHPGFIGKLSFLLYIFLRQFPEYYARYKKIAMLFNVMCSVYKTEALSKDHPCFWLNGECPHSFVFFFLTYIP